MFLAALLLPRPQLKSSLGSWCVSDIHVPSSLLRLAVPSISFIHGFNLLDSYARSE